jgi:hypothetical protein
VVFFYACNDHIYCSISNSRLERFFHADVKSGIGRVGLITCFNQNAKNYGGVQMRFFTCRTAAMSGAVVAALSALPTFAEDPAAVSLPNTGVDVASYATAAITTLGGVVAVCVGGVVAFMLVRAGIRWIRGIK